MVVDTLHRLSPNATALHRAKSPASSVSIPDTSMSETAPRRRVML